MPEAGSRSLRANHRAYRGPARRGAPAACSGEGATWSRAALDAAIAFRAIKVAGAVPRRGGRPAAAIARVVEAYYVG